MLALSLVRMTTICMRHYKKKGKIRIFCMWGSPSPSCLSFLKFIIIVYDRILMKIDIEHFHECPTVHCKTKLNIRFFERGCRLPLRKGTLFYLCRENK